MSDADWNIPVINEFRANEGRVGGNFEGAPLLLLTTTGRRTGNRHTTPVMYLPDGDRLVIFASKGGSDTDPDWYTNLVANPRVTLEVGSETYEADAEPVTAEERDTLYARQAALYPGFADYERKTTRVIPVIALRRVQA
jgi:deazaflavin-dependent oxidoreductase (nitroreductase family)